MPRIRTKSGTLTVAERRRRIRAASPRPGEIVLLDQHTRRTKGKQNRNSIRIDFHVPVQWAVDIDVRKLVHELRVALAEHYSRSLLAGQRADGTGPLPRLAKKSEQDRTYGVKSGEMARHWMMGAITGGPMRARCRIKPWGGGGRAAMINRALEDDVDFQAVDGVVSELIDDVVMNWLRRAVPSSGDGVATPVSVPLRAGKLSDL